MSTKVFEYFPVLLPELRMMMIDEMEPDDRCRFTRCSRLFSNEAKNSKKYIEELQLFGYGEMDGGVTVVYRQDKDFTQHGYSLEIIEISDKEYIEYRPLQTGNEVWRMEVNSSTDAITYVVEDYKRLLDLHQNRIKNIFIDYSLENPHSETLLKNYDFGIKQLNNLESLIVYGIDIEQFVSKIRKPLKKLQCSEASNTIMPYFDQISQVQDVLSIPRGQFNYDQFLQLTARKVEIEIGELTETDIFNFINSWKNGELRDNFESCAWYFKESEFDIRKFFRLFGGDFNNSNRKIIEIKHNKEVGKKAELRYFANSRDCRKISFEVIKLKKNQLLFTG